MCSHGAEAAGNILSENAPRQNPARSRRPALHSNTGVYNHTTVLPVPVPSEAYSQSDTVFFRADGNNQSRAAASLPPDYLHKLLHQICCRQYILHPLLHLPLHTDSHSFLQVQVILPYLSSVFSVIKRTFAIRFHSLPLFSTFVWNKCTPGIFLQSICVKIPRVPVMQLLCDLPVFTYLLFYLSAPEAGSVLPEAVHFSLPAHFFLSLHFQAEPAS